MEYLIIFILAFALGYFVRSIQSPKLTHSTPSSNKKILHPKTQQQRLQFKSYHQTDSDRIRELNLLTTNQSAFLRLLKQTFFEYEIAVKNKRFIVLDRDHFPFAIFEYRDGTQAMKVADQEDGLPLYLYKGLISSDSLKQDYMDIMSVKK